MTAMEVQDDYSAETDAMRYINEEHPQYQRRKTQTMHKTNSSDVDLGPQSSRPVSLIPDSQSKELDLFLTKHFISGRQPNRLCFPIMSVNVERNVPPLPRSLALMLW